MLRYLQRERENLVGTLDGLSEYDVRRPMRPTGTSLLGLVKHVLSVELGYLADCPGRPSGIELTWDNEQAMTESADMWAKADEGREWLLDLYRQSWAHCDATVRELGPDAPATVSWWAEDRRETTLGICSSAWSPRPPTMRGMPTSSVSRSMDGWQRLRRGR